MIDNPISKTLIVIAGPTASGKTAAAIELAKRLNTEIFSADSRQFYREMSIGTAKPSPGELKEIKHHFINSHSITENFSVGDFEKDCLQILHDIFETHDYALLVGGSGLYIKAICEGFDELPSTSAEIRDTLNHEFSEQGITHLRQKLKIIDPLYYTQVDLNNPQRIIRALEVTLSTGKPFSAFRKATVNNRPFRIIKLALDLPRSLLYQRINQRVDDMVKQGLVDEARALIPFRHFNALSTVGYTELFDFFDEKTDLDSVINLIKQNTRHFAKRQLTWFRKDKEITWVEPNSLTAKVLDLL